MSDKQTRKKVALVTGASSGMGKAIAARLLGEGFKVYVAARSVNNMQELVVAGAKPLRMDISKDEDVVAAVNAILAADGGVDVLVNNAGFGLYGSVEDVPLDEARYQFEVNLFGLARLTQLLLPAMRERGAGRIVNITSMGGKIYTPLGAWYHATKHALEGWSDCLRLEVAPFGIDVVIVEPGIVRTGFGGVTGQLITRFSGGGAYEKLARTVAKATAKTYAARSASEPKVVADVVVEALQVRRPRTRYVVGSLARPLIVARRWLGDRMFDRLIMSQVK
ncbi:oxidoreductase [Oricola sp.]|uniref:oxidoreductase n=1 Tax=Oricola sp. TaxID=1979950 RepID=UPI0025E25CFD|nr:oxidoreductase [Oricola sp.]MCI5076762.1 oxidoreductase [Oricola sp.]